jgi:HSP20 family protein
MNDLDISDPFRHLRNMERKMKRLFSDFPAHFENEHYNRTPFVDILNTPNRLEAMADLSRDEKKNINLNVHERSLSPQAKKSFENKDKNVARGIYNHEQAYSHFARSIPLPAEIVPDKMHAKFINGILKVSLPKKSEEGQNKRNVIDL